MLKRGKVKKETQGLKKRGKFNRLSHIVPNYRVLGGPIALSCFIYIFQKSYNTTQVFNHFNNNSHTYTYIYIIFKIKNYNHDSKLVFIYIYS